jgi:hypothetical protein
MVGANYRISRPVRLETVEMVRVQDRARRSARIAVAVARTVARFGGPRYDPMPMDNGDIVILTGRRVPAQQMIVVRTNFSGPMMVPDVVKISLG